MPDSGRANELRGGPTQALWVVVAAMAFAAAGATSGAEIPRQSAPEGAHLYFITPQDGATVSSPFTVRFGLSGMGVAPAGVSHAATGHHHLIVDAPLPPLDRPIPSDDHHHHFGGGQTETTLELPPGDHTLQLLLGDANHVPFDPPVVSKQITVHVK